MRSIIGKPKRRNYAFVAGVTIVALFCIVVIFADFLAPYDYREQTRQEPSAPPSSIRFRDASGNWHLRPFIYANRLSDPRTMQYSEDTSRSYSIRFFTPGSSYKFLGILPAKTHLFGVSDDSLLVSTPRIRLLGTDQLGRDRFSRLLYAIRFSLIVSPLGTLFACAIGIFIGITSGYAHRTIDTIFMGAADAMMALPTLILILAARTAFPLELPPISAAILLICIFALTGWAEMARLSRGLVAAMREREFVLAARASGLTGVRILTRHILPNIARPLITQATLLLPAFLLAEIALSFLGVGLQEPEPSLGNMLTAASDLSQLAARPLVLLSPAFVIFLFILGLRLASNQTKKRLDSFD